MVTKPTHSSLFEKHLEEASALPPEKKKNTMWTHTLRLASSMDGSLCEKRDTDNWRRTNELAKIALS